MKRLLDSIKSAIPKSNDESCKCSHRQGFFWPPNEPSNYSDNVLRKAIIQIILSSRRTSGINDDSLRITAPPSTFDISML